MTRAAFLGLVLAPAIAFLPAFAGAQELNALVWCDHADPALIEPFEERYGVEVNLREYEGTGAALALLERSRPGDWDVLVIDAIDVFRAVDAGLLAPLPEDELPLGDQFDEVVMRENNSRDGTLYAATEKFGYNTVSYDVDKVDEADMQDMEVLLSEKYAGRVAIYDYYLPVIGLAALMSGIDTAAIGEGDLDAIRETLFAMEANATAVGGVVASQTALATGEADVVIGGGEWLTATLGEDAPSLTWTIPEQGAVRWAQSIGILEGSTRPDLALEFVKYILSPEAQAKLATSSCFWGMPANEKAGEHLTDAQKATLRWDEQADYLARTQLYPAPGAELDAAMQDLWLEMQQR
ncbi:MAG: PotD/PotF family extracellular solute-binding protein [Paracoccaceae bacterium]